MDPFRVRVSGGCEIEEMAANRHGQRPELVLRLGAVALVLPGACIPATAAGGPRARPVPGPGRLHLTDQERHLDFKWPGPGFSSFAGATAPMPTFAGADLRGFRSSPRASF